VVRELKTSTSTRVRVEDNLCTLSTTFLHLLAWMTKLMKKVHYQFNELPNKPRVWAHAIQTTLTQTHADSTEEAAQEGTKPGKEV
jgi:hypothetical protein